MARSASAVSTQPTLQTAGIGPPHEWGGPSGVETYRGAGSDSTEASDRVRSHPFELDIRGDEHFGDSDRVLSGDQEIMTLSIVGIIVGRSI